nr:AlNc14C267G9903 [Albugo laibachii Nc14]|eukprot:CCA24960.1 AlNc14C267G9903 [Albugo laibachii Nc14]
MVMGWNCKKQTAVAFSTAEAEYAAASIGGEELLSLEKLAKEIGLQVNLPICMNMNNHVAIKQAENEAKSSQAKHVDVRLKSDILTKPTLDPRTQDLRAPIGLN